MAQYLASQFTRSGSKDELEALLVRVKMRIEAIRDLHPIESTERYVELRPRHYSRPSHSRLIALLSASNPPPPTTPSSSSSYTGYYHDRTIITATLFDPQPQRQPRVAHTPFATLESMAKACGWRKGMSHFLVRW